MQCDENATSFHIPTLHAPQYFSTGLRQIMLQYNYSRDFARKKCVKNFFVQIDFRIYLFKLSGDLVYLH